MVYFLVVFGSMHTLMLIFVCCLNAYFNDRVTLSIKQHDYAFSASVTLGGIVNWNNQPDREAVSLVRKGVGQ